MKTYSLFLIEGHYCVAKMINCCWVVWLRTKSKLEAELFLERLQPPCTFRIILGKPMFLGNGNYCSPLDLNMSQIHGL